MSDGARPLLLTAAPVGRYVNFYWYAERRAGMREIAATAGGNVIADRLSDELVLQRVRAGSIPRGPLQQSRR